MNKLFSLGILFLMLVFSEGSMAQTEDAEAFDSFEVYKKIALKAMAGDESYKESLDAVEEKCSSKYLNEENTIFYPLCNSEEWFIMETSSCVGHHGNCGNLIVIIQNKDGSPKIIQDDCGYVIAVSQLEYHGVRKFLVHGKGFGEADNAVRTFFWNSGKFEIRNTFE